MTLYSSETMHQDPVLCVVSQEGRWSPLPLEVIPSKGQSPDKGGVLVSVAVRKHRGNFDGDRVHVACNSRS